MADNIIISDEELDQVTGGKKNKIDPNKRAPFIKHTVCPGDTVSALAYKYHTSVDEIARLNHMTNPSIIKVGEELLIPNN